MSTIYADNIQPNLGSGVSIPGHVVQYVYRTPANANFSSSTTETNIDVPNFYVDITPKYSNSILVFKTTHTAQTGPTDQYGRYRVVDSNNGDAVFNTNSDIAAAGYKGTQWIDTPIQATNVAGTTNTMRLQLQVRFTGAVGTFTGSWSSSADKIVEVWEIAQ